MLTIVSDNGTFKAEVSEIRNGCRALFFERIGHWRKISHTVYDLPFHAALDAAQYAVNQLRQFPYNRGLPDAA
jgi:hypothetical protein